MNFAKYLFLIIVSSAFLWAERDQSLEESYKNLVQNSISTEKRYELANSAMDFGLFESAIKMYEDLLATDSLEAVNINAVELRFSLIKANIGNRNFNSAELVLNEIPEANRKDQFYLYNLITQYILNYKQAKKDMLDLLKRNLKQIRVKELEDEDKAWYYYFKATEKLIEDKESDLKDFLFQAKVFSESNVEREAFFESLILRLEYNSQKPSLQTLRQLKKLLRANQKKKQAYFYAYDYAYMLAMRGDENEAIEVINDELLKGEAVYSLYELDNLRLLKVIVLGPKSVSGRDLLFTLIQSSKDNLILDLSFRLLREYVYYTDDSEFLNTLSLYFQKQVLHPLRFTFYTFKAQFILNKVEQSFAEEDEASRILALNQLKAEAEYILENFPGTESLEDIYQMLVYVALNQPSPQYRLAADYLSKVLDFSLDGLERQKLNLFIGNCYFLNDDFEVAAEFYMAALSEGGLWYKETKGQLWFRLVTAKTRADLLSEDLIKSVEEAFMAKEIPFDTYLKIQWNIALHYRKSGKYNEAVTLISNALNRFNQHSVPVLLDVRFKWFSLYVKYLSVSDSEASIVEAQLLLDRLNELSEGVIEETALSLLKSQVTLLKAQFLLMENQADEASSVIANLQNTFPDSQAAELSYIVLADFYTLSEEFDLAESYLLKLAKKYPESDYAPEALLEAALNAEKRESNAFAQSIQLLNQLANTYSDSSLVFFAIRHQGDLLRKASDFSGALSVYDNLIQKFPDHPNRYLADLSRLDCLLALANKNTEYDFKEIILELERLLDLPDLPNEFQLEVRYKLAFILSQLEQFDVANNVILSIINDYIDSNSLAENFSSIESYWIARSLFLLCDHLNSENQIEESKKIYRMIIAYNLPGFQLAKQLLLEL
ncbi:MAG: hypothetical protein P8I61_01505 [Opitutae bacterium]|nr:hypothetical protein [Opitutae bacterium]